MLWGKDLGTLQMFTIPEDAKRARLCILNAYALPRIFLSAAAALRTSP